MDELLHQVAKGDPKAVAALLDRYGGLVYSLARRFSYSPSEVEDAVQEVFSAIWQSAGRFDPTLGAEETFVATVARRRLIDRRRRAQRRAAHVREGDVDRAASPDRSGDGFGGGPGASAEQAAEFSDEAHRAVEALSTLRPEQQRCLRLSIYHGLSHEEIAASTGIPLGTVKTHVRRGLIAIRDSLEKQSTRSSPTNTR
jgi:RNA polymerase sigma-70 factor (ECF subfamily)